MDDHNTPGSPGHGRVEPEPTGQAADEDFRATADSIRADGRELSALEDEKLRLRPGDPRIDALSARAVELAERIAMKTRAEQQLAEELG